MDFRAEQRLAITKVIIQPTDLLGGSSLVERRSLVGRKYEDNAIFYENDSQDIARHQNRPLYVTASVREVVLRSTLVDIRSLPNVIHISILMPIRVPHDRITKHPIEVSGFECNLAYTFGFVNLNITVKPMRTVNRFKVIDAPSSYHMLLGRPWIHRYKAIPSTYHQCLKAI